MVNLWHVKHAAGLHFLQNKAVVSCFVMPPVACQWPQCYWNYSRPSKFWCKAVINIFASKKLNKFSRLFPPAYHSSF